MTIDQLKAYKRKAKAQRDNWKARAVKAEVMVDYLLKRIIAWDAKLDVILAQLELAKAKQ